MKLRACIVDTETTGFSHASDDLIELGLVLFEFDALTGDVGEIISEYSGLQDCGREIPDGATQAHGMTWDDVRGHKLDDEIVCAIFARASLLVAHNARFDRGFVAKLYPEVNRSEWRCSMDGIPWRLKGFRSKGLQELLICHGLTVMTAHRALDDAHNTLRLLSQRQPDGRTYWADLLKRRPSPQPNTRCASSPSPSPPATPLTALNPNLPPPTFTSPPPAPFSPPAAQLRYSGRFMRSVPLVAPRQLELIEAPMPDGPRRGELLVRLVATGLCGSDLHWWAEGCIHSGRAKYPQVLGHEPVGEIVELGPGVHGFKTGDRISIEPSLTCGHCEFCIAGRHNLCVSSVFMGGPDAQGFLRDYAVIPTHNADPIPDSLSWHEATLMEPVAVWVHVFELMPLRMGETVAIMGCGSIGLLGIAMAKAAGAEIVLACDRVPHRLAIAKTMGADVALDINHDDFLDAVMQKTRGRGVDVVFDAAGAPQTINLGLKCARAGGRFMLIGIPEPPNFEVDLHTAMSKELSIQTLKRSNHKGRAAAALLESGRIPTALITHTLPLSEAQQGFELLHGYGGGVGKLIFDHTL